MKFSFEVRETDLLGRTGRLMIGAKVLETPYLFPVIHPVDQIVPTEELMAMGFRGLMTNSYIIRSRRRREAEERGIHDLLGFQGVFITDSGGYQALEYGDLGVDYREIAMFQSDIGSDLAVTLDRPTGYPQARGAALDTVGYSLKNARATLKEFGDRGTVWVGPIQGGVYQDLVRGSAKAMTEAGFDFLALGSPVQVMESYMFSELVGMIMAAREGMRYATPLHLFGAGHPLTMPLAVALGCDTFDSASYVKFARTGRYMSRSGVLTLKEMKYLPCSCPACSKTSVKELLELGHAERTRLVSTHNLYTLKEDLEACKEAIAEGRLWDLVEERSMVHPRLREAFIELAGCVDHLMAGTPALKDRGLFVRSALDRRRPELESAATRLSGAIRRSSRNALLISATAVPRKKPRQETLDVYREHPVLGPYPVELDFLYPFSQTEVSTHVVGGGPGESRKKLKALGYARVYVEGCQRPRPLGRRQRMSDDPMPNAA